VPRVNARVALDRDGDIAVVTIDNPPVNALSAEVRDGLFMGITTALADADVAAIVLMCSGTTFVAGGDISALGSKPSGAPTMEINRLQENSPKPIVAAMHGSALGGGLEITFAAHWRIATRGAKLGLPEVKLGILPGAGGTQRLPRLIGIEPALRMIVTGDPVSAEAALEMGLIDALADPANLRAEAVAFARQVVVEGRPLRRARDLDATADPQVFDAFLAASAEARRGAEAPIACVRAVRAASEISFDQGIEYERELLYELIPSLQSQAMRHLFFAEREAWKLPGASRDTSVPSIRTVCILTDSRDGLAVGRTFSAAGLKVTFSPEGLETADLVFDPTFTSIADHRALIARITSHIRKDAIVSTMAAGSVDDLTAPERTLGIHFFHPADERPFVEVIRPSGVSIPNALAVLRLLKRMGKKAVVATPAPGAIAATMMSARQRAAELLVANGWSTPAAVDAALTAFGFAEGVFIWLDRIGLDTGWLRTGDAGDVMRDRLCAAGRIGRAGGAGFYDYDAQGNAIPSAKAATIIGGGASVLPAASLIDALLIPIANTGQRLIDAGTAMRDSDIDLVAVVAHGWPAWKGGPLFHVDKVIGAQRAIDVLAALSAASPAFYAPASGLAARGSHSTEEAVK
jgi:3-hydroxyacyl-CoA dehydrogenase